MDDAAYCSLGSSRGASAQRQRGYRETWAIAGAGSGGDGRN